MTRELNNKSKIKAIFMRRQSNNFIIKDIESKKEYVFEHNPNNSWVEGELLTISVEGTRKSGKHKIFLQGTVIDSAIDIKALNITPLKLHDLGEWDPLEHYGEEAKKWFPEYLDKTYHCYEMEAIDYYYDEMPDFDPCIYAMDLFYAGKENKAKRELGAFLCKDWRYLDGHNHLGLMEERVGRYEKMRKHYELAVKIGSLTINKNLKRIILPWSIIENRPFLRALHGYGLALAHLGLKDEALGIFEWCYEICPMDNLGVRFLIDGLKHGKDIFEL